MEGCKVEREWTNSMIYKERDNEKVRGLLALDVCSADPRHLLPGQADQNDHFQEEVGRFSISKSAEE